jgi:phenylacetate-coenzyme A ligase PaaK-like adenylate-forming protein
MPIIKSLYNLESPFLFDAEAERLFLEAMRASFNNHYNGCDYFNKLCALKNFSPESLKKFDDIYQIPYIFVNTFKERELISVAESRVKLELTSSGTGGQKSRIVLDKISLDRILKIVRNVYGALGMVDDSRRVNYICFTYDPEVAKNLGSAFSDKALTSLAPAKEIYYAIQFDKAKNDFFLNEDGVKRQIIKYSRDRKTPLRILGFPAFIYKILAELKSETGRCFNFGPRSFVMTGGGWKGQADKEIEKRRFKTEVGEILGMPPENVRDLFGMVEHGIPYVECAESNMHIPIYSRARVRHPLSGADAGYGAPGVLHLYTPYINSVPSISLLCTDKAVLRRDCPCGIEGDYIELLGRGGITKHKGCAVHAAELLLAKKTDG